MSYRLLWIGAAAGVLLHLAGLGLDAYLHARDTNLAAREGVFTLSNPGHLLILAGVALTTASVFGTGLKWLSTRATGGPLPKAVGISFVPLLVLVAAGSMWLVSLDADADEHPHDVSDADPALAAVSAEPENHTHPEPSSADHHPTTDHANPMSGDTAHGHEEVPVSPEQLLAAAEFYEAVKAGAAPYEDIRTALAEGYIQVTQDLPGIAAHFLHPAYNRDGALLDPEKPEILLYTKRLDGTWRLVGVMFSSESVTDEPPSFFGPLDAWHRHENLCFTIAAVAVKEGAADCTGLFVAVTPWNLHVWTAPVASGVFAHDFEPIDPGPFPGATQPAAIEVLLRNR